METKLLRNVPYLRDLPDRALRRLMKIVLVRSYRKGGLIFSWKEAGEHLFIVAEGRIKIFVATSARKQKTFAVIGPGEFFGELALLEADVRTASAQAIEDSKLLMIPKRGFKRFLLGDPAFMMLLLRTLAQRLRRTNETIEGLLFQNVLGRVATALVDLQERTRGGAGSPLNVTHKELAAWVGTSREPLSRALGVLRRGGLVSTGQGRIKILNPAKLRALAKA